MFYSCIKSITINRKFFRFLNLAQPNQPNLNHRKLGWNFFVSGQPLLKKKMDIFIVGWEGVVSSVFPHFTND